MKGKIRFLIMLLMFLVFLPANIFAEDKIVEAKDTSSESVSLDIDQVSKDQQNADKESEVKDPEKKDLETVEKENLTDQEAVEEAENDLYSKNQTETNQDQEIVEESENLLAEEDEEASTKDLEKQETTLEDDIQNNGAELEISDLQEAESVKVSGGGGSSGGGSGCFSSGGGSGCGGGSSGGSGSGYVSSNPFGPVFYVKKVDENGKPMKVAFRVTNLGTDEPHIVITDENGLSCTILASPFKSYKIMEGDGLKNYFTEDEINELIKKITDSQKIEKPDIFAKDKKDNNENQRPPSQDPTSQGPKANTGAPDVDITGPKVDTGAPDVTILDIKLPPIDDGSNPIDNDNQKKDDAEEKPEPNYEEINDGFKPTIDKNANKNDKFLDDDKFYRYTDLEPKTSVQFVNETTFEKINKGILKINIEYGYRYLDINSNPQYYYKKVFNYGQGLNDELIYEDVTPEQLKEINLEKLNEYAKKRIAQLVKINRMNTDGYKDPAYKYLITYSNSSDIYKFEELRTDTNKNYSLKTFYIESFDKVSEVDYAGEKRKQFTREFLMGDSLDNISKKPDDNLPVVPGPDVDVTLPDVDVTGPKLDISTPNIQTPVRGGGSSVGGSGSGKGVLVGPPVFKVINEKFKFETFASHSTNKDEKVLEQGGRTQVTDKISFDKLSKGKEYKFVGKLINKRTGEEVKTEKPIVYETGKLTNTNGEASITITFDSSIYQDGDEFVLIYDIFEDGKLAGYEKDLDNPDQSFKIISRTTPPPEEETPPPEEETPPPKEETPPPKEETPPPKEEVPPVEEVEKESPKEVVEVTKPTPVYMAPKTYDPGIGLNVFTAILSGAALTFLRKRK